MVGQDQDLTGLPSYFEGNPWVEILANRGQEDVADLGPVKAPGVSAGPAISTASQLGPPASQAPSGQDLSQLISSLVKLTTSQIQVTHAQASAQPMVIVVPIIVQVPVPYPWPVQSVEIGGHGGVLCTPRHVEGCSAKPLGASPPGFKSRPRRQAFVKSARELSLGFRLP